MRLADAPCVSDAVGVGVGVDDSDRLASIVPEGVRVPEDVSDGVRVAVCDGDTVVEGVERSEPEDDALAPSLREVVGEAVIDAEVVDEGVGVPEEVGVGDGVGRPVIDAVGVGELDGVLLSDGEAEALSEPELLGVPLDDAPRERDAVGDPVVEADSEVLEVVVAVELGVPVGVGLAVAGGVPVDDAVDEGVARFEPEDDALAPWLRDVVGEAVIDDVIVGEVDGVPEDVGDGVGVRRAEDEAVGVEELDGVPV